MVTVQYLHSYDCKPIKIAFANLVCLRQKRWGLLSYVLCFHTDYSANLFALQVHSPVLNSYLLVLDFQGSLFRTSFFVLHFLFFIFCPSFFTLHFLHCIFAFGFLRFFLRLTFGTSFLALHFRHFIFGASFWALHFGRFLLMPIIAIKLITIIYILHHKVQRLMCQIHLNSPSAFWQKRGTHSYFFSIAP